jgi:choice-of-anchor A domain-containing protein
VLVFGDYEAPSSQVQGKLAVGGDIISLDRYSVADQLPNVDRCSEVTLVVGGSVQNWTNGLNYYGNIVVGQSSPGLSLSVLYPGCCVETRENFFNFDDSRNQLIALSRDLSEYSTTVREISVKDTFLNIILNQFSGKAVINIKDPLFFIDKVKFIQPTLVENLPEGMCRLIFMNLCL